MGEPTRYQEVGHVVQEIKIRLVSLDGLRSLGCFLHCPNTQEHDVGPRCFAQHWGPLLISVMKPGKYMQYTFDFYGLELHMGSILTAEEQFMAIACLDYSFSKMMELKNTLCFWQCFLNFCTLGSQYKKTCLKRLIVCALLTLEALCYAEFGNQNRFPVPLVCLDLHCPPLKGHILLRAREDIADLFDSIRVRIYSDDEHRWVDFLRQIMLEKSMEQMSLSEPRLLPDEMLDSCCLGTSL